MSQGPRWALSPFLGTAPHRGFLQDTRPRSQLPAVRSPDVQVSGNEASEASSGPDHHPPPPWNQPPLKGGSLGAASHEREGPADLGAAEWGVAVSLAVSQPVSSDP